MFRSIRFRLALWYTTVIALTFVFVSLAVYEYVSRTLSHMLDQSITNEVRWIVARLEKREERFESEQIVKEDVFEHAAFYPIKEYIEIWDASGKLYFHSPNLGSDTLALLRHIPLDQELTLTTVTNFRYHDIRLAIQKTPVATVLVAMPVESITTSLNELLRIFLWLGPVVVLVGIFVGSYLAKKSFSKINQVIETAKSITADRLHDRIPEHHAKDEIGKIISTFNEMISRLDISFQQMKQFSADASHELRTPLTVMRSQLETALNSRTSVTELKKIVANCLDETIRMTGIIENLLLLAKGDAEQIAMKQEVVDLSSLVQQTYDESVILASQKEINVTLDEVKPTSILGDAERLRQMLLNLIDNSIKYTPEHGRIHLGLSAENGYAKIVIADTGIGIPENEIPRIFNRFYRVDRARSRELGGAGLGLSIAQWIVLAHRGSIRVASKVNEGSEFSVLLPLNNS